MEGVQEALGSVATFEGHTHAILSMAVHNERLYTASVDQSVLEWPLPSLQHERGAVIRPLRSFVGHTAAVSSICIDGGLSISQTSLFSAAHDGTARCWDLAKGICR